MISLNLKSSSWVKINCALTALVAILMVLVINKKGQKITHDIKIYEVNPCCGYPCQHGGVCVPTDRTFLCDCSETGYFGKHCETPTFKTLLKGFLEYHPTTASSSVLSTTFPVILKAVNYFSLFQRIFNKNLYSIASDWGRTSFRWTYSFDFTLIDFYNNLLLSARSLPPTPKICPTPMGFYGPKKLPDVDELYERLFKRKTFRKCPKNTNILFATYLHHFVSQFDNLEECEVTNVIDMWHIYGKKEAATNCLRSFQKGKLKTRYHNDEEFPPLLQDCPQVAKMYPQPFDLISKILGPSTLKEKWALGNPQLNMTPLLCVISTIWIREHNRVCNVLANKNPHWGDDELYHTARLIVTGEAIKITLTEIMKHLMQSHIDLLYKPEFTSDLNIQHTGCVPRELSLVPLWQCLMPDEIQIGKSSYNCSDLQYSNNIIFQHGINQIIHSMSTTPAGETTNRNIGTGFKKFITKLINESRALKVQSYNNYRKRFGLKPKKTFEELTGDLHLAAMLKEFYIDVDAVELIVGFLTEEKGTGISPPSMTTMGGSWLIRGLLSHPINSPDWWKPKTFGGHLGMNIVKTASLKKLICLNLKDKCHNIYVGLKLPKEDN